MVKAPHHKTQAQNAITKHYHQTQALMGATRPAGIKAKAYTPNKDSQTTLITRLSVSLCLKIPTRDASPPLVFAFGGSVWCLNPFVWLRFTGRNFAQKNEDACLAHHDSCIIHQFLY